MNDIVRETKEKIEEFLMNSIEHQDKHVDTILFHPNTKATYIVASSIDNAIEFSPYTKHLNGGYDIIPEWDYNFDYYIFDLLEKGCEVGFLSDQVHYSVWNSINELYPKEIECKDGLNKYIKYCKDNNITKEYLDENVGFNTPDIRNMFNENKIRVLYVEPGKLPKEMLIDNTLEAKQHLVGDGYIECVYLPNDNDIVLICNEEGKINHMKWNRDIGYDVIAGPFIIAGDDYENGDFKSLTDDQVLKYKIRFDKNSIKQTEAKIIALQMARFHHNDRDER